MDTVVYSASPLKAFSGGLLVLFVVAGLGMIGMLWAIFKRNEKTVPRILTGCASVFLLVIGAGMAVVIFLQWQAGVKSVSILIDEKKVVRSNCEDPQKTCTSYLLETNDGQKYYDFTVSEEAFNSVDEAMCYQFTYYPSRSLFSRFLGTEEEYSDSYEQGSAVTQIKLIDCP
jgi:hypothetical protein